MYPQYTAIVVSLEYIRVLTRGDTSRRAGQPTIVMPVSSGRWGSVTSAVQLLTSRLVTVGGRLVRSDTAVHPARFTIFRNGSDPSGRRSVSVRCIIVHDSMCGQFLANDRSV